MGSDRRSVAQRCALLALIAVLPACETPSVDAAGPAYDPSALTGGILYHWPVGTTVAFHVLPGPTASDDRLATSVHAALGRWAAVLAYSEHSLRLVDDLANADVIVRDPSVAPSVDIACAGLGWTEPSASTLFCPLGDTARTLTRTDGGPGRVKMVITIDVVAGAGRVSGLEPLVVHEIGHALGIGGHSALPTDVMFATPGVRFPSVRDALTLRFVLHRRPELTL